MPTPEEVAANAKKLKASAPVEAPKEVAQPKVESPETERSNKYLMAKAIAGLAPALLGGLFGGAEGGAIGAQAGQAGMKGLSDAEAMELDRAEKMQNIAMKKAEQDETKAFRDKTLGLEERKLADASAARKHEAGMKASERQLELASKLRSERSGLGITKNTQEVVQGYEKVKSAAQLGTAAGDMSVIYGYMKMNDPGSSVKEGEFATAENAAGIPERVRQAYNKAVGGDKLTNEMRAEFVAGADNLLNTQLNVQGRLDQQYEALAAKYGVPKEDIMLSGATPQQIETAMGSGQVQSPLMQARMQGGRGIPGTPSANAAQAPARDRSRMSLDELEKEAAARGIK